MVLDQSHEGSRTAPDHDEIVQHIQLYIDGFNQSDASKFRQCFDEDAWILFTDADGTLAKGPLRDVFDEWAGPDEPKDWEHRILSVTQAGDVASVILEMHSASDPNERWVDIHSLLRIDGQWKDMNKTATHASRADWAGVAPD
ncbi:MAG TPA: nuclear transport factor 2 family protein [Gaiellales bacterium]|nr:nuclear transport factor 2 family protein [Gaiellales bacterium]